MRRHGCKRTRNAAGSFFIVWQRVLLALVMVETVAHVLPAQTNTVNIPQQIQQLTDSMARAQEQIQESQRQLDEMRQQLKLLQEQTAQSRSGSQAQSESAGAGNATSSSSLQTLSKPTADDIEDLRERQGLQESQIATHEQTKVESESKYPVKVTGLLLLNAFVNASAVDMPSTPALAVSGSGSTGATVRQTVLGIDATGPHLFGATSHADLRVDFDGNQPAANTAVYSGYYNGNSTLLRLRTAHVGLQWPHTEAYFSLDHPIFSPDAPTSLAAVAEPSLAWSGNLWTWNPQLGITQDLAVSGLHNIRLQTALIDVGDPPVLPPIFPSTGAAPPTFTEQSRWPGVEARIAILGQKTEEVGNHFGVGGYFAPHLSSLGRRYDSWAGTLDTHLLLPEHFELTATSYRGLALGGLGGGGYKDFVYRPDPDSNRYYFRALDDVGGWAQLKRRINERVELNAAFGLDNVFARELRPYAVSGGNVYQNLARNRTYTGNVIYSPSAYLLFSIEYRHLASSPVIGPSTGSNIVGLAAGYKF